VHSGGSGAAPHDQVRPEFVNKWLTPTLFLEASPRRVSRAQKPDMTGKIAPRAAPVLQILATKSK
jgi:hypothetical protein